LTLKRAPYANPPEKVNRILSVSKEDEPAGQYPGHPARLTPSTEPLEDAFAKDLLLPGLEIEDCLVRMIGADVLGTAAESLEPDGILPALPASR
jgi:hypothetical protein